MNVTLKLKNNLNWFASIKMQNAGKNFKVINDSHVLFA